MTDLLDSLVWAYRAVFTQTNAGGGNIKVNITSAERMLLLYGEMGPDDYAADRTIGIRIEDSGGKGIAKVMFDSPFDNETIPFPTVGGITVVHNRENDFNVRPLMGVGDSLELIAQSLVQDETLTLALRMLVRSTKPTVSTAGSTGTVTTTLTYDKVI